MPEASPQKDSSGEAFELPWTICSDSVHTGTPFDACHPWQTTIFLPLLADELYFATFSCAFSGRIHINADGEDAVRVTITMYCTSPSLQREVEVQRHQREPEKYSLIFVVCFSSCRFAVDDNHAEVRLLLLLTPKTVSSFTSTSGFHLNASANSL